MSGEVQLATLLLTIIPNILYIFYILWCNQLPMRVGTGILYGTKVEKREQKKEQRERVDLTGLIPGPCYNYKTFV